MSCNHQFSYQWVFKICWLKIVYLEPKFAWKLSFSYWQSYVKMVFLCDDCGTGTWKIEKLYQIKSEKNQSWTTSMLYCWNKGFKCGVLMESSVLFCDFHTFQLGQMGSSNICIANTTYGRIIGALLSIFKLPLYPATEIWHSQYLAILSKNFVIFL